MTATEFDLRAAAEGHAAKHTYVSPDVTAVYYLPQGAPDREIRLVEISDESPELTFDPVEAFVIGVGRGTPEEHRLEVVDLHPSMWDRIRRGELRLPAGWSLAGAVQLFPGCV